MNGEQHCGGQVSGGGRHRVSQPSTWTAWTRAAFAAIVLLLSLAAPVAAGPSEDVAAMYSAVLRHLRPLADQGNANAQFNLGFMYSNGQGVPQNHAEALKWYRLAADQGNAEAQLMLGAMYRNGDGVPQDYAEALKWHRLAADQGNAEAQYFLGFMYSNGQGVPQNHAEALKWYRLAADQGNAFAQFNVGVMYMEGAGVPQDYVRAHMWFNLSAAQEVGHAARDRDELAKVMTPEQIAEAQNLAREWQPKRP
ncbi:tetratricopeptide repeat protein [Bosea sp. NBC_00550]|uniref:tetratricopeptide repeat protein n=1 Tax=Bosea sp. NBC_00550 TaxID=2969621 RepID=UPI00222E5263|nr:tetratricopeptide repeat protein [Bosea sp. NBC_00550]UZF93029.1 sel1 repeat family protein [Bosea sp. NBC_00550]